MLNDDAARAFADELVRAEVSRVPIAPLTAVHSGCDTRDAYRVASFVTEAKLRNGRTILGYKIGLTSAVMRELAGADEPDYGALFDDWFVPADGVIPAAELNRASVEAELAFVLAAPLRGPGVTPADVVAATESVHPALEIVDSRYTARGPGPVVVDSIADAAWCGRVVISETAHRLADIDVEAVGCSLLINGEKVADGVSSAVMGNPITAVAWLANTLGSFGVEMQAGHVVLSGSFLRAMPISPGDTIYADFAGFGDVGVQVGSPTTTTTP